MNKNTLHTRFVCVFCCVCHTSSVDGTRAKNGKLVKGSAQSTKRETLVVVVHMRVGGAAGGIVGLDVVARGDRRRVDLRGRVDDASAGGASAGLKISRGGGADEADEGEDEAAGGELHFGGEVSEK